MKRSYLFKDGVIIILGFILGRPQDTLNDNAVDIGCFDKYKPKKSIPKAEGRKNAGQGSPPKKAHLVSQKKIENRRSKRTTFRKLTEVEQAAKNIKR